MPTDTSSSAIGISSHFRRGYFSSRAPPPSVEPAPPPAAGSTVASIGAPWQQRLGRAVATGDEIDHGGVGRACRPAPGRMLEGRGEEVALQRPRVEVEPAPEVLVSFTAVTTGLRDATRPEPARTGSVGSKASSARLRRRLTRPMPATGSTVQRRVQVLRRVARQHHGHRRCAAGGCRGASSSSTVAEGWPARRSGWPAHRPDDAHGFERGLASLRRLGGDVEQDQRAGFHVLQLQPRGRDGSLAPR